MTPTTDEKPDDYQPSEYRRYKNDPLLRKRQQYAEVYSAPRRFDLATMLVVTTGYAALFSLMRLMKAGTNEFAYFSGLVTLIAIVQSLTPAHVSPRTTSVLTGIVYPFLFPFILSYFVRSSILIGPSDELLCCCSILGPLQGYVGGTIDGGTFLVAEFVRKILYRLYLGRGQQDEASEIQSPWDEPASKDNHDSDDGQTATDR